MSFHPNTVLPPLKSSSSVSHPINNITPTPVLPPLSCLAPPIPPLLSPITPPPDFAKNSSRDINPLHLSPSQQSYISPPQSERTSPHTSMGAHFHFHPAAPPSQPQYVDQQQSQPFSSPRNAGNAPQPQ